MDDASLSHSIDKANIIFSDLMVTVNIFDKTRCCEKRHYVKGNKLTVHIPFKNQDACLTEIALKMKRILHIAKLNYHPMKDLDIYKDFGLKKHLQPSTTESKIMFLVGEGHNIQDISKIMNRSELTVGNHCRSITKKMGGVNRVEFYKCALMMANFASKERLLLCL
ncbi:hypothetical protein IV04_07260 [Serratia sp. Ag1]|nr:hypothetical protein JV45_10440 [Serratia sp. Ag2]KFK99532.1 hypothetical protein IV04_07260 [Serratia sp. Ag1]